MNKFLSVLLCFCLCITKGIAQKINAIGIWEISKENRNLKHEGFPFSPGNHIFKYDGSSVTLYLFSEKEWMWQTEDSYYKVKSKWSKDSLFYMPPFGNRWSFLAVFNNGHFEERNGPVTWKYKKIEEKDVPKEDGVILKERKLHDYTIKPTDIRQKKKN